MEEYEYEVSCIKLPFPGGEKDEAENLAYLPVKIMENQNNTPIVAQWNYRIMCHPIQGL